MLYFSTFLLKTNISSNTKSITPTSTQTQQQHYLQFYIPPNRTPTAASRLVPGTMDVSSSMHPGSLLHAQSLVRLRRNPTKTSIRNSYACVSIPIEYLEPAEVFKIQTPGRNKIFIRPQRTPGLSLLSRLHY